MTQDTESADGSREHQILFAAHLNQMLHSKSVPVDLLARICNCTQSQANRWILGVCLPLPEQVTRVKSLLALDDHEDRIFTSHYVNAINEFINSTDQQVQDFRRDDPITAKPRAPIDPLASKQSESRRRAEPPALRTDPHGIEDLSTPKRSKSRRRAEPPPLRADPDGNDGCPDPQEARTEQELLALLQKFRKWARNSSSRQLSAWSDGAFSHSTINALLADSPRTKRPPLKLEYVQGLIRACGGNEAEICRWTKAWRRITAIEGRSTSDIARVGAQGTVPGGVHVSGIAPKRAPDTTMSSLPSRPSATARATTRSAGTTRPPAVATAADRRRISESRANRS